MTEATSNYGTLVDSGEFSGLHSNDAQSEDDRGREAARHRRRDGAVPAEGLGHLPPALLGHADPDDLLREGRDRPGAGRPAAGRAAEDRPVHRARRFAAGAGARVRQREVSEVRRSRAARDRHDGHLRRLVVVLLPLRRSAERQAAVRSGGGQVLAAGGLLQRRRRARDPAPDLLALLRARLPRPRLRGPRRAVHAAPHAGHGAEGRRGDVEVEGQRRRSRHDAAEVRRRRAASLRDVRGAAGEGSRVDRYGPRRELPLPRTRLASRGPLERHDRRRRHRQPGRLR